MRNIREYYMENFPTDELGVEINENATLEGLYAVLTIGGDVYEYIGVGDSMIRERLFWGLSQITATPYNEIYAKWLMAE
jgi:hypothetical protein